MDAEMDGFATGLTNAITRDGQSVPTANIPMGGFRLTGLGAPSSGGDATTKTYVDAAVTAVVNATVRIASAAALTKASAMDNGKTVDGVVLATGDRVLLKNQAAPAENGVWVVAASGAPARATDFDTWAEFVGSIINVTAGTANTGLSFRCTVNSGGTLDTTAITYTQFGTTITTPISLANGGLGSALTDPDADYIPFWDDSAGQVVWLAPGAGLGITGTTLGISVMTTRGDIIYRDASAPARLPKGTTGQVLTMGANDPQWSDATNTAATQAEQETATSLTAYVSPGRQQFHPSSVKFWAYVNGAGTSLLASYNITGITDTGAGDLGITIATDMSSVNYACVAHSNPTAAQLASGNVSTARVNTRAVGSFNIANYQQGTGYVDPEYYDVIGAGDQ